MRDLPQTSDGGSTAKREIRSLIATDLRNGAFPGRLFPPATIQSSSRTARMKNNG